MVKHIVFMKLEDNSEKNKVLVKDKLISMKGRINVLKEIEVGINFNNSDRAYDIALVTLFENKEDLKAYAVDEIHLEVIDFLKSINTITKVVDYYI